MSKGKKEVVGLIKLQVAVGKANPAPPIGPALGQKGLNIMDFCKEFNAMKFEFEIGTPIPVTITAYKDRSFTFTVKSPPTPYLIMKEINLSLTETNNAAKKSSSSKKQQENSLKTL